MADIIFNSFGVGINPILSATNYIETNGSTVINWNIWYQTKTFKCDKAQKPAYAEAKKLALTIVMARISSGQRARIRDWAQGRGFPPDPTADIQCFPKENDRRSSCRQLFRFQMVSSISVVGVQPGATSMSPIRRSRRYHETPGTHWTSSSQVETKFRRKQGKEDKFISRITTPLLLCPIFGLQRRGGAQTRMEKGARGKRPMAPLEPRGQQRWFNQQLNLQIPRD